MKSEASQPASSSSSGLGMRAIQGETICAATPCSAIVFWRISMESIAAMIGLCIGLPPSVSRLPPSLSRVSEKPGRPDVSMALRKAGGTIWACMSIGPAFSRNSCFGIDPDSSS